jgi:hypothetical protein
MTRFECTLAVVALILIGLVARVIPHTPNFAPVTATALFCGAHMSRRQTAFVLFAILLTTDYLLLYVGPDWNLSLDNLQPPRALYHNTLPYVYGSFALSALVGTLLRKNRGPVVVGSSVLFCSLQFFFITNAAVWLEGAYARDLSGLWQSYVAGIPFFRATLLSDLLYTAAFFGLYELTRRPTTVTETARAGRLSTEDELRAWVFDNRS